MKATLQLAQLFDQMSDIFSQISGVLKTMPDAELQNAFSLPPSPSTKLQNPATATSSMNLPISSPAPAFDITSTTLPTGSLEDLPEQLNHVPSEQLESFIRLSSAWNSKTSLQALADQLGVRYLKKNTKPDLLNLIVTHIESRRGHSQIRNYEPEHAAL